MRYPLAIASGFLVVTAGFLGLGYFASSRCSTPTSPIVPASGPLRAVSQTLISAPAETVFDYIAGEDTLPEWMPDLDNARYEHTLSAIPNALGPGSKRFMKFGEQIEIEEIVQFSRPSLISYRILEGVPVTAHISVVSIEERGSKSSLLTWHQYFEIKRSSLAGWMMPFLVRRFMSEAQGNLIETFEGEAIQSNQCKFLG